MKNLSLHNLTELDHLLYPAVLNNLTLESSALSVMVDFSRERPYVIETNLSAIEANRLMMKTHTNVALVVNNVDEFVGLVSSRILTERSIIRLVANGMEREHIAVTEVMLPRDSIQAIDIEKVKKANVGEIVKALQDNGEEYCLVVDGKDHVIRGLFGISDIARRLHTPILIRRKNTLVNLVTAMSH